MHNDNSAIDAEDEGLELLLGGLPVSAISPEAWNEDEKQEKPPPATEIETGQRNTQETPRTTCSVPLFDLKSVAEVETYESYARAFHWRPDGQLVRPPVRIIDMVRFISGSQSIHACRMSFPDYDECFYIVLC